MSTAQEVTLIASVATLVEIIVLFLVLRRVNRFYLRIFEALDGRIRKLETAREGEG